MCVSNFYYILCSFFFLADFFSIYRLSGKYRFNWIISESFFSETLYCKRFKKSRLNPRYIILKTQFALIWQRNCYTDIWWWDHSLVSIDTRYTWTAYRLFPLFSSARSIPISFLTSCELFQVSRLKAHHPLSLWYVLNIVTIKTQHKYNRPLFLIRTMDTFKHNMMKLKLHHSSVLIFCCFIINWQLRILLLKSF